MKTKLCTAAIILTAMLMHSCEDLDFFTQCVEGKGAITEEYFKENTFSGIELTSSFNIFVKQGDVQEIKAVGNRNIIDELVINEVDGILACGFKSGCYRDYKLTVYITVPRINKLTTFGSGDIIMGDFSHQGNLTTKVWGSGNIIINSSDGTQNLDAVISGSGDIVINNNLTGLNKVNVKIHGSGCFRAYPLLTNECFVYIFGSGDCYCSVISKLTATITGSGNMNYKGNPIVDLHCAGTGRVNNRN